MSPHISELAAAGSPIVMGSDNMAEDMIEVMRTGLFMERVRNGDGTQPTPKDVLQWARPLLRHINSLMLCGDSHI